MSGEFQPRFLTFDSNVATSHRRLYSTILAEFSWYSEVLVLKPESLLAHSDKLPAFESFLSSLHGFEDALFHFVANSRMAGILGLLGVNVITTEVSEPRCFVVASHEPTLSLYDFQKLCSVLCAYRFFEIISLRAQCISRIPISTPTACMFLPGPPSAKDLDAFSRLKDWPKLAMNFQKIVQNATDGSLQFRPFSNPVLSLMHMAARNEVATKYLAIQENFLLAAIHVAAMKNIPFAEGTLPDLPANMPSVPPGGFKDEESYERFEIEYNAFIETCRMEGCLSSAAQVGSRSPFQLAVMISPLYLLVTLRLSTKSFHRRTVIDVAARLGPHKPNCILAVESAIWDAIFRLAEGRISAYAVLCDLANSLPWADINIALNCEADKQWFTPGLALQYVPAVSFPQLISPSSLPSTHLLTDLTLPPSLAPRMDLTGTVAASLSTSSACNAQQQRLLLLPPPAHAPPVLSPAVSSIARRNESDQVADACPTSSILEQVEPPVPSELLTDRHIPEPLINKQTSSSRPQHSPFCPPQSTLLNPSPVNYDEAQADRRVTPLIEDDDRNSFANALANNLNAAFAGALQQNANPLLLASHSGALAPHLDFDLDNSSPAEGRLVSESRADSSSDSDGNLNDTDSDRDCESPSEKRIRKGLSHGRLLGTQPRPPSAPKTSTQSNGDDLSWKETTQSLGAGGPNASTKRRRSASPISPRKLGSEENPIDVDKVSSLFEPVAIREYVRAFVLQFAYAENPWQVKKEEISLPLKANPPIKGNSSYTIFDVTGKPKSFTPSFHFKVYHERFRQFFDCAEALYDCGQPLHIARPGDSIIKSFTYEAWRMLTPVQMQQQLSEKNVIVTGWPLKEKISFNEDGLRKVAGTQSRQISINDYSIKPSGKGCGPTVVSGRVRDIWDNRHASGRILNALDLPLYDGNTEPTEYASDLHAWDVTRGHHRVDQASSYPTEHMRWALVGHENAITFLHIDCEGLSTEVLVADGGKAWGFLRERPGNPLSSVNFFLQDSFRIDQVLRSSEYDFEIVALRPGDKLFMMSGQPHFVFSYAHSICLGGHYYLTNQMQRTLQGLIHSFVLHKFLTNTSHPTRVLLRRMVLFYHMGLIENEIPESGAPSTSISRQPIGVFSYTRSADPAASHLPNINTVDGLMDLLSACVLVILGNVLDFRTYRAPTQEEYAKADKTQQILIDHELNTIPVTERFAICYARGVALHLISWIRRCSVIVGPGGDIVSDLPSRFFVQVAQTLIKYKEGANASQLDLQANCTLGMLTKQINNAAGVDPCISSLWSERHSLPSDSLALANQEEYSIQWPPDAQRKQSSLPRDFFYNGVTGLDECYFEAQRDRQLLESSLLIPQLKNYSSASQRSSKRARLG